MPLAGARRGGEEWRPIRRFVKVVGVVMVAAACGAPPPPVDTPKPVTLTNAPRPGVNYAAIIGDSFVVGLGNAGTGRAGWPSILFERMKNQRIFMAARLRGGPKSGWVDRVSSIEGASFEAFLGDVAGSNDKLLVLFGGACADGGVPPDKLADAVQSTLDTAVRKAPQASIVVVGPVWTRWIEGGPPPDVLLVRDVLESHAAAARAIFVDPVADQWFAGRPDLIGRDGVSPNDDGYSFLADRLQPVLEPLLPAAPA
jgi:lysophospholipase L1-like esterase